MISQRLNKFAVVKLWPELNTAETECLYRIKKAAQNLGLECFQIDSKGVCFETNKVLDFRDVDFAIHLHYETPKNYDIFSFVALWNPTKFFFDWGYDVCSTNLVSHDDFLTCSSRGAEEHVQRFFFDDPVHLKPLFQMFHSCPQPLIDPIPKKRSLAYVGINWERLTHGNSRHAGLLRALDDRSLVTIYGPYIFSSIKVWEGYKGYSGEIPFDGESLVKTLSKNGAVLVLSSQAHIDCEMMSNRLFEALAAGAIPICDENPFAKKHFGNCLLYVNSNSKTLVDDILKHLTWVNDNQQETCEMILRAQKIFREKFSLEASLSRLYMDLDVRKQSLFYSNLQHPVIKVFAFIVDSSLEKAQKFIDSLNHQTYKSFSIDFLVDTNFEFENELSEKISVLSQNCKIVKVDRLYYKALENFGSIIASILDDNHNGEFQYYSFLPSNEEIFHNHYQVLTKIAAENPGKIASSACILVKNNSNGSLEYIYQNDKGISEHVFKASLGYSRFLFPVSDNQKQLTCFVRYLNETSIFPLIYRCEIASTKIVTMRFYCINSSLKNLDSIRNREILVLSTICPHFSLHPTIKNISKIRKLYQFFFAYLERNKKYFKSIKIHALRAVLGDVYRFFKKFK